GYTCHESRKVVPREFFSEDSLPQPGGLDRRVWTSDFFRSRRAARVHSNAFAGAAEKYCPESEWINVPGQLRYRRTRTYLCGGGQAGWSNESHRPDSKGRGNSQNHSFIPGVPGIPRR